MKVRLAVPTGTRAWLRCYWGTSAHGQQWGYHNAELFLGEVDRQVPEIEDKRQAFGRVEDYADDRWPVQCGSCGEPVPAEANRQVFTRIRYDTSSGLLEPGCMYWASWYHARRSENGPFCFMWDNCTDPRGHLHVVLPNNMEWDIDSRAKNCTLPQDRLHRCWVREGEPPLVTVGKGGYTCSAGAGSIQAGNYHGFLRNGELT